jgi:hypothetical protein
MRQGERRQPIGPFRSASSDYHDFQLIAEM